MTTATSTRDVPQEKHNQKTTQRPWFRFEMITVLLSFWYLGGLFIDGWAHNNGRTDESFFTLWHAVFYSGFAVVALFYGYTVWRNVNNGKAWSQVLPKGHHLALIGIVVFASGGFLDMIWHEVFGVEEDIEALLSPSHLLLGLGMVLVFSGSFRSAMYRKKVDGNWADWITPTLSLIFSTSVVMFFLQYLSPTGAPIGYYFPEEANASSNMQVYSMNPDGTQQTRILNALPDSIYHVNVSPDGQQVAYVQDTGDDQTTIFVANFDGSDAQSITDNDVSNYEPSWSPDGTQIAFISTQSGNRDIFVFDLETNTETQLTHTAQPELFPAWSPDGSQIAYTLGRDARAEIYVMTADGSNIRQVTDNSTWESFPVWSPNGDTLAISREIGDDSEIIIINLDGDDVRQVTDNDFSSFFPYWTADGEHIVYTQYTSEAGEDIYSIPADGGEAINLTNNPILQESYAQVTQDGSIIYRVRVSEGAADIDTVNDLLLVYSAGSLITFSAILIGGMMLLLREGRPPFGALTLFWTITFVLVATQDDGYYLVPLAFLVGLTGDILVRVLNVSVENGLRFVGFAFLMPVIYFSAYFGLFEFIEGIKWSVDVWTGSIAIAGFVGALIAYLIYSSAQPRITA